MVEASVAAQCDCRAGALAVSDGSGAALATPSATEVQMRSTTLALVSLLFVVGCGATVSSSLAPTANVSQYRTFAFHSPPYKQGKPESLAEQEVRGALKQSLEAKGLRETQGQPPDFLVAYHVVEQQKLEANDIGYGFWGVGGADLTTYTQGTLVVDFVDPQTRKVFWRGTASQMINDPQNPNAEKLQAAVVKLIKRYPYTVASTSRPSM
jgi:hypothetical protein